MEKDQQYIKEQLLREVSKYVHLDSGRKRRTDKNQPHQQFTQTKMALYNRIKNKLSNRRVKENNLLLSFEFDENGFYLPIPEMFETKAIKYKQEVDGRTIDHNIRRVRTQKYIDLEQYRFEAWQELALTQPASNIPPNQDLNGILFVRYNMTPEESELATIKRKPTWEEIFCEVYHIKPTEIFKWSYEDWRKYYEIVPKQLLDDDFVFEYGKVPGTEAFHPEWNYKLKEIEQREVDEKEQEEKRKSEQYIINLRKGGNK